jgi:hypothetical protein
VLSQIFPDGCHPIGFLSRKLRQAELNYDTHDKELLAIIESLKGWRHWTMETRDPVKIMTDHNNLRYFMTSKELNRRQVRWAQFLSDYNFELIHRPGKENVIADALSRRAQDELGMGDRAAQNLCLLPPERFVKYIEAAPVINKVEFNEGVTSNNYVHDRLINAFFDSYASDEFYLTVSEWLNSDPSETPVFPEGSGKLPFLDDEPDTAPEGRQGFYIDEKGVLFYMDRLYVPKEHRVVVLTTRHDSLTAGHLGVKKTSHSITRDFWWPKITADIENYVKTCDVCQRTKVHRARPPGLLKPLPTPSKRWSSVTMDFMTDLPPCDGYDAILVVVDRYTKMAHYVPCTKDITAEKLATLYIDRIFRHHGMPEHIISDRGTQFNSAFWVSFLKQLNVEPCMSTAYHPETDGQTERVNSILNQYLRVYCNFLQDNWVQLLPLAEFAYNNSVHSATLTTPFMANYGVNPASGFSQTSTLTDEPNELSDLMKKLDEFLQGNLEHARAEMKKYADRHRQDAIKYKSGDKVLLSLENMKTRRPKAKWSDKRTGPYTIVKEAHPGSESYVLDLPKSWNVYPVFHTSLLTPYRENNIDGRDQVHPPPVIIDGDEEYEIEQIVASRRRYGKIQYLVKWKGYPIDEKNDWFNEDGLAHAQELLDDFLHSPAAIPPPAKRRHKRK